MIKILWMLYLAFTLYITVKSIYWLLILILGNKEFDSKESENTVQINIILTSLLWFIWYFYYLN